MVWLAAVLFGGAVLVLAAVLAVRSLYRTPRVPHRRTPELFDISFEEIRFPTAGGKELYGWWIPAAGPAGRQAPTLVLVHGWRRNVERLLPFIRRLAPASYNLLVFDARGHGSSDAHSGATMLTFSRDIQAAFDEALRRPGVTPGRLGVLGLSVGGGAAIYAAAHDARIRAVVSVGAFAHPGDVMRRELARRGVPAKAIAVILRYVEWRIGARLDDIAPERQLGSIDVPVLLIHGEQDAMVPPEQGRRLGAAGASATLWMLPNHGHSDCDRHPEFWPTVLDFLADSLAQKDRTPTPIDAQTAAPPETRV